ncbi:low temperature requirement protein A [Micromonospora marina]|uniref:low temperature requirement protein A n=1 Tax=Micromonospora marina TaxID=307120 RepID=UPI003453D1F0
MAAGRCPARRPDRRDVVRPAAARAPPPRHIAEQYGLFTIIVLGETIAAASVALQSAVDGTDQFDQLLPIAAGGLLIIARGEP